MIDREHQQTNAESTVPASVVPIDYELTSIIIVTHNELAYTRLCLESVRLYTRLSAKQIATG